MSQDVFSNRHIGVRETDYPEMLAEIGVQSIDALIEQTVPHDIRLPKKMDLPTPMSEAEYLAHIHTLAGKNKIFRSLIGRPTRRRSARLVLRHSSNSKRW